jgi:hypothetical protein
MNLVAIPTLYLPKGVAEVKSLCKRDTIAFSIRILRGLLLPDFSGPKIKLSLRKWRIDEARGCG